MLIIPELEEYRNIEDKFESNFTIVVNGLSIEETLSKIFKKLEYINKKKDNVKRMYLNDRLYILIEHLKQIEPESIISNVYLVGKSLNTIPLHKKWVHILNSWQVDKFIIKNDDYFDIDYLNSLFLDDTYYDVIKIMNKTLTHTYLNQNKRKTHLTKELGSGFHLSEYVTNETKNKCLVHGISSIVKNSTNDNNVIVINKSLNWDDIFMEFKKESMLSIHKIIEELFNHMLNEKMMHRVKVTKELQKAIQYGTIETIYCLPRMAKNIKDNVPTELQNFKIVEVLSLIKGDVVDRLDVDFKGAIGYTYY
jgi:hypothetical protein